MSAPRTTPLVAIVDYGSGNLHSAAKALERAAREGGPAGPATNARILVTPEPDDVARADAIVLPGVGAFADCRRGLDAADGLVEALEDAVLRRGRPFLGICVGMQLMAERGLEHEVVDGLGWVRGEVATLRPDGDAADASGGDAKGEPRPALRVPHMGWNTLERRRDHPLLAGIPLADETGEGWHAYFVHSFALRNGAASEEIARAEHGRPFPAIVGRDNLAGTQFHPEKSQALGLALLANFLAWRP